MLKPADLGSVSQPIPRDRSHAQKKRAFITARHFEHENYASISAARRSNSIKKADRSKSISELAYVIRDARNLQSIGTPKPVRTHLSETEDKSTNFDQEGGC